MNRTLIAIVLALALIPGLAMAQPWTAADIALSGTAGSGSNASYLVVDFGSASYAFNYLWNTPQTGTVTGADLIGALSDQATGVPGLSYAGTVWPDMGLAVDSFGYDGHSGVSNYPDPWWNYWTGAAGGTQESSGVGCSSRELSNGSIDSWVFSTDWTQAPNIPGVPEPSSLLALCSLIGLVGSARLLRRSRK